MGNERQNHQNKAETTAGRALRRLTGTPLYIVGLLASMADRDKIFSVPISAQSMTKGFVVSNYWGLL